MKIVKIYGGLGNQMFQYAFALSLASRTGDRVYIDSSDVQSDRLHNGYELSRLFDLRLPEADQRDVKRLSTRPRGLISRARRKYFTKPTHIIDKKYAFQRELYDLDGDFYFEGYWQSEKYFADIEDSIRKTFAFVQALDERSLSALRSLPRPIVGLHVRRGDFTKHQNLNICTPTYYAAAMSEMCRSDAALSFMIFSEDIEYCRKNLDFKDNPVVFVDWNTGADSWRDMALMSMCDHNIIANSSFSWWGAWLNQNPGKIVIAPAIWNRREIHTADRYYSFSFEDVVPSSWKRMPL